MLIHIFNSFDKCLSLYNKEGDKFRLIGFARTEFGEVHVLGQQFCFQFLQIYYFGYRYNGKATKVGVEDKGLRSVSLMIPIPEFPLNLSSSSSNFVRK